METIGLGGMAEILKSCTTIMGKFPEKMPKSWDFASYQLIGVREVPLKANGRKVGNRTEWHVFTVGALPGSAPDTFMHVAGGEAKAIRLLILDEIADRKRDNKRHGSASFPRVRVRAACWGEQGDRPATFKVAAGRSCDHDLRGNVYAVTIGDYYLHVAGFGVEPANKFGHAAWDSEDSAYRATADSEAFHYTVDPAADGSAADGRKVA